MQQSSPFRISWLTPDRTRWTAGILLFSFCLGLVPQPLAAEDISAEAVLKAITSGKKFLISQQQQDGSWTFADTSNLTGQNYQVGFTSLAVLALLNCGLTSEDPAVRRGLQYLRKLPEPEPAKTYECALMIMALATAKDPKWNDKPRLAVMVKRLEDSQATAGELSGLWSYQARGQVAGGGDPSNGQFAVLALREAAEVGVLAERKTWSRVKDYWLRAQKGDGGWSYHGDSTGSMTVAGVATLTIANQMLQEDKNIAPDGTPPCCDAEPLDDSIDRGVRWLGSHFSVRSNPGMGNWLLYYIYGMERAGRLSGQRFFGQHDWYREGALHLVSNQNPRQGSWAGVGAYEADPVLATSLSLLFLSKGLSPVLINKVKHGTHDPAKLAKQALSKNAPDWNRHNRDARNLADLISGLPKWPSLLTAQEVDLAKAAELRDVGALLQAPVVYLTGSETLELSEAEVALLKQFFEQGGFMLATANCKSASFEDSFRALMLKVFPPGEGELKKLGEDHLVYRSEYLLSPETVPLYGIDSGCRTAVIYSPEDLGCYWDLWSRYDPPGRNLQLKARIIRATQVGINVIAYATGREPPNKLQSLEQVPVNREERIGRGMLEIAKLKHTGGWDAAPRALKNLLLALDETAGVTASTKVTNIPVGDKQMFKYPLVYMHGRTTFQISTENVQSMRQYLDRGGMLFADACCGAQQFDKSFREFVAALYPDTPLQQIPVDHDMFSAKVGREIKTLRRRTSQRDAKGAVQAEIRNLDPFLEGVEMGGRYVIVYSRYDISCALERQTSVSCEGYVAEDATKLATNIVLYSLLQEIPFEGDR